MSNQITTVFAQQFGDNLTHLLSQKGSRLRQGMGVTQPVRGKWAYVDQIGTVEAVRNVSRHADSPLLETPFARRRIDMVDIEWGDLIDNADRLKTLVDPTNPTSQTAGWAIGRDIDRLIRDALFGDAFAGETGGTTVTFPAGQQIAVNFGGSNVGLTIAKLIEARRLLMAANVDMERDGPFWIAVTAKQMADLLNTTQVTSADFNSVRALVRGEVSTFMGFNFLHTELLNVNGSAHRRVPVWAASGMALGVGMEPVARIEPRADKRFSTYVYYSASFGCTRLEETKVVEVICLE